MSSTKIDPILPFKPYVYDENEITSILLELNKNFGFRRFLLIAPGIGVRLTGFPDRQVYRKFGEFLLVVKNKVADRGIQIGWWCAPSLKSGKADYQRITGIDGSISEISSCPLDEDFSEVFAQNIATVVEIANPFMIQFEDDFELSNHGPVRFGCFCPLHLKKFSEITGRAYSRDELSKIFSCVNDQSIELRKKWAQMSCDTLVNFARRIRQEIDKVSPETRVSLCQAGCAGFDGNFTQAVAAAFAGNTKPIIRIHGTTYSSDDPQSIPQAVFNVLYSKENLPGNFELIHESDTYPHTRFFMSASKLKSLMAAAFSYGMDDSLLYTTQYMDDPIEESGYSEMFKSERRRFETLKSELQGCHTQGCEICSSPWSHCVIPYNPESKARPVDVVNPWVAVLGKLGIPYSTNPAKVKMLAGNYSRMLSNEQVKELLSSGVLIDGKAAHALSERGFSDLIGARITPGGQATFWSETIADQSAFKGIKGQMMYNLLFAPAGSEGGQFYEIVPSRDAKVLTNFCTPNDEPAMPGMISFENSLGGRVVITAFDLENNRSSAIFNYRKKEIICQAIEWAGGESLPVFVKDSPNVFCIYNGSNSDDKAIVTLINLCSDTVPQVELQVSQRWQGCKVEIIDSQGQWVEIKKTIKAETVTLPIELKLMEPAYLKISNSRTFF